MDPRETHRCRPAGATTGARRRGPPEAGDGLGCASTATPTRRGMAHAIAADEGSGVPEEGSLSKTVTLSGPLRTRRPRRRAAAWDERPRSRVRRTAGGDPCGAGPPARRDPPASTCDGGSRAAWPSSGCWADRCASLTSSSTGDCRVTLGHPGASRARSMYLDPRDELWHTSAPCSAVRARKTRRLAGSQGRGRPGQRQRALWILLLRGLGRPVVASASRRGGQRQSTTWCL